MTRNQKMIANAACSVVCMCLLVLSVIADSFLAALIYAWFAGVFAKEVIDNA
jgi:phosphate starvation-inducible membrane PsiE